MAQQCIVLVFGATGDLAKKKLIPALANLHAKGHLHKGTRILAVSRRPLTDAQYHKELLPIKDKKVWASFLKRVSYHQLDFSNRSDYLALKGRLAKMQAAGIDTSRRVFHLATLPESFPTIIEQLSKECIAYRAPKEGWHRVVFEKPFGHDLSSAHGLNTEITRLFDENQVYRIDHYLGKELVQNLLVLRFTNPLFDRSWNSQYVSHVTIRLYEQVSVEGRGEYYDKAGALRDMVQNHMLQLLALTAMEMPATTDAHDIHYEKVKVLKTVEVDPKQIVLGQYTAGKINRKSVTDYRKEEGVRKGSTTETYAAVKLHVNNRRWHGVPFYLSTGKALKEGYAEITITFKEAACLLFCGADSKLAPNKLTIRIQPHEGVKLQFNIKELLSDFSATPHEMDYHYDAEFRMNTPEAYERLLSDVIKGDRTLFTSWGEVEYSWRITDALRKARVPVQQYPAGSTGPDEAKRFLPD
jgi:glucose-6-phosphate 1-dehydrogenase